MRIVTDTLRSARKDAFEGMAQNSKHAAECRRLAEGYDANAEKWLTEHTALGDGIKALEGSDAILDFPPDHVPLVMRAVGQRCDCILCIDYRAKDIDAGAKQEAAGR